VPGGAVAGADGRAYVNDKPDDFIATSKSLQRIKGAWAVDFDHQIQLATNPMAGGRAPAAGWITELQNREGSIWGKVEWTDLGTEAIQKKHYRGISPVFAYDPDSKRALGLLTAALTNNPNLNLVALNSADRLSQQEKSDMEWLNQLLKLPKEATKERATAAINSFIALSSALATAIGVDLQAALALNAETLNAALSKKFGTNDVLTALCAKAGVKADAGVDAIVAALATPDPAKFVPMEAHMALKNALEAKNAGEPGQLVDQALKDGRLYPSQKEWALNYAKRDLEGFKKYVGATPERLGDAPRPKTDAAIDTNSARDLSAAAKKYIAEQSKLGIAVTATQAVAHVTKQAV